MGGRSDPGPSRSVPASLPSPISLADAYAYCRRITRASSSNFYHAFRLLTWERQNALCAVYAFCRFIDDIADQDTPRPEPADPEAGPPPRNRTKRLARLLNRWRDELSECYRGQPNHPISRALADAVRRFPIRQADLSGIIDGVEMDLARMRYQTFAELYDYCYRVASLVGLVCIEIFGYRSPRARDYAVHLGVAFQLTNIMRDVGEDAERGRIYLPLEDLAHFGCSEADVLGRRYTPAFVELMRFQDERARAYYGRAVSELDAGDRRSLVAAEAMRLIYSRLLKKIAQHHYNVFTRRITLPTAYKLGLAVTAWAWGRSSAA